MLFYALIFFLVALATGVLGFGGLAGTASGIAQVLFVLFLMGLAVSVVLSLMRGDVTRNDRVSD